MWLEMSIAEQEGTLEVSNLDFMQCLRLLQGCIPGLECYGLTQQVTEHHTVSPPFLVGWGERIQKTKNSWIENKGQG